MTPEIDIRQATNSDKAEIWKILAPIIKEGSTYPFPRDTNIADALNYWFSTSHQVFVATIKNEILGTYYIRPNQTGAGSHVANCGYVTAPEARGKGIARAMCCHSQDFAIANGFKAMQFNFVIATNVGAIGLWQKLGFKTMCYLPEVFDHPSQGMVDALVMFKKLD